MISLFVIHTSTLDCLNIGLDEDIYLFLDASRDLSRWRFTYSLGRDDVSQCRYLSPSSHLSGSRGGSEDE